MCCVDEAENAAGEAGSGRLTHPPGLLGIAQGLTHVAGLEEKQGCLEGGKEVLTLTEGIWRSPFAKDVSASASRG